ncbi:cupin domain-containing protein [Xylophilus sp. Kf1]|nr:cupin domain-containing protein [Xylophilus sp. Kf1]
MPLPDFQSFETDLLARGFDEVLVRAWAPDARPATHSHPFDAQALVVEGEMWLETDGVTRHLLPGDGFVLPAGTTHDEWYGPQGAVYWVARRNPA